MKGRSLIEPAQSRCLALSPRDFQSTRPELREAIGGSRPDMGSLHQAVFQSTTIGSKLESED